MNPVWELSWIPYDKLFWTSGKNLLKIPCENLFLNPVWKPIFETRMSTNYFVQTLFWFFFSCLTLGCMYTFRYEVTFFNSLTFSLNIWNVFNSLAYIIPIMKKQSNNLQRKSLDWFLYWTLNDLRLAVQIAHITTALHLFSDFNRVFCKTVYLKLYIEY